MYEHLKGKTLMVMDRTSLAACAVIRAKEMGIRTVVANFYKTEDSPSKQVKTRKTIPSNISSNVSKPFTAFTIKTVTSAV